KSYAHSSAHRELAANAPDGKRGRRKQGPPQVQGTHDAEAGGPCSRARSRLGQAQYAEDEPEAPLQPPPQAQVEPPPAHQPPPNERNVEEEGYGGGPTDLSLLSLYHNHRAILIWDAQANDEEKVISIQKPNRDIAWFWCPIEALGLEPLTWTNYSILDHGVLTAFAERWHPETSTFHLPIGEVGITLDDVQCLLLIPIEEKFLNHRKMTRGEGADMADA
ncbi:putative IMP dehydrogenase/GMP reductase, partial [Trifolium medium]|nr:putative IMP dehydrogenase/GMP reductase [Trifolium medium]